jgi:hypothetical protein
MHLRRGLAVVLAVPAAFAVLSFSAPMADASIGVGVQASPVRLASAALTGQSYALPAVYVSDTGTQPESITVQVQRLSDGRGRGVPQSWIHASGPSVRLAANQSARIPLELTVPPGAKPGRYMSDIVVTGSAGASPGQANLGAAAATPVEFTVRQGAAPSPLVPTWTWWFGLGLVALFVLGLGLHRSGIRIRIERLPPSSAPSSGRWSLRARSLAAVVLVAVAGLAACSTAPPTPAGSPGGSSSIAISLKTVPTLVSVTVSPATAKFGNCTGGASTTNTKSSPGALGFPNGQCWLGKAGSGASYPITITNTGVAATIDVSSGNAIPSGGGPQWGLCNLGPNPATACTNESGKLPGNDQYLAENFAAGKMNTAGLTASRVCDTAFAAGGCSALQGDAQQEGVELTGPQSSDNHATSWTVTITWTAIYVPDT